MATIISVWLQFHLLLVQPGDSSWLNVSGSLFRLRTTQIQWMFLQRVPKPIVASVAHDQGCELYFDGNLEQAILFLEVAAQQYPYDRALCGMARIRLGMLKEGADDLKEAIKLNREDAGQNYVPSSNRDLPEQDIKHGIEQMKRLLRDRPMMTKKGIDENDALFIWAARKFAGEDLPWTIDWNDKAPEELFNAQSLAPTSDRRGYVQIATTYVKGSNKGRQRSPEEMWASLVFELHNVANAVNLAVIRERASKGEISKGEYVWAILESEYRAAQRTRAFYATFYLPWLIKRGELATEPENWKVHYPFSFEEYKDFYRDRRNYPWIPYGEYYDILRETGDDTSEASRDPVR